MPLKARSRKNDVSTDPDFEIEVKKKSTKERISTAPIYEEEDIMALLIANTDGLDEDEEDEHNENNNDTDKFLNKSEKTSVKEQMDQMRESSRSKDIFSITPPRPVSKPRASRLYQRTAVPRPDSPEIIIPKMKEEDSSHYFCLRDRDSTPEYDQVVPSLSSSPISGIHSDSPLDVFDEARLIETNNPLDKPKKQRNLLHPKKRIRVEDVERTSVQAKSPYAHLVAKRLVIPCLQPVSRFAHPPESIEFYNKRSTINQSRQKNYAIMTVSKSSKKKQLSHYEIESIVSHKKNTSTGDINFLIKWRAFGNKYNTWEPPAHFMTSPEILLAYFRRLQKNSKNKLPEELQSVKVILQRRFNKLQQHSSTVYVWQLNTELSVNLIRQQYKKLLKQYSQKVKDELGPSYPDVEVRNNIDFNLPPLNFTFVRDRFAGKGVHISNDSLIGCVCAGGWGTKNCCLQPDAECCPRMGGAKMPYNMKERLVLKPGFPIYECNARCSCGPDCGNRVIQRGPQIRTAIFKTPDKGWGLKTLEAIPRGTFVVEYVGEVINFVEAEKRGSEYDAQGLTYLFDLDYSETHEEAGEGMFTIDAAFYGNTSHFINHSCEPNLVVYSCWISNLDIRMPHICLFASRNIAPGEELSFNYRIDRIPHNEGSTASARVVSVECKCGAKTCMKQLHG